MGSVGVAGLMVLSGLLCGLAVYWVMARHMDRLNKDHAHKVEQFHTTIKQLTRIANARSPGAGSVKTQQG